jgi:hypothetical protein
MARTTCNDDFVRWRQAGFWDGIIDALAVGHDAAVQMIDLRRASAPARSLYRGEQRGAYWPVARRAHQQDSRFRRRHWLAFTTGEARDNRLCPEQH